MKSSAGEKLVLPLDRHWLCVRRRTRLSNLPDTRATAVQPSEHRVSAAAQTCLQESSPSFSVTYFGVASLSLVAVVFSSRSPLST